MGVNGAAFAIGVILGIIGLLLMFSSFDDGTAHESRDGSAPDSSDNFWPGIVLIVVGVVVGLIGYNGLSANDSPSPAAVHSRSAPMNTGVVDGQATLPEGPNKEHLISEMKVGETAYTEPWAMQEDLKRHLWLDPNYNAAKAPAGTTHMMVVRELKGYHVWISASDGEAQYTPEKLPESDGTTGAKLIPVATLTIKK